MVRFTDRFFSSLMMYFDILVGTGSHVHDKIFPYKDETSSTFTLPPPVGMIETGLTRASPSRTSAQVTVDQISEATTTMMIDSFPSRCYAHLRARTKRERQ